MMRSGTEFLKRLLDALLPNRASPVLARVLKAHEGAGKTKYSLDVRVLKAGTLEDTEEVISEVPLNPVWIAKKKRGVYAIPNEGQVVIVEFLGWNPAYPFIAGMWADEYEAANFTKDSFLITDGEDMRIVIDAGGKSITIDNGKVSVILSGDKCAIKNGSKNLFTILDTHLQNLIAMKTTGSPTQHVVSPGDVQKFTQDKSDLAAILEA